MSNKILVKKNLLILLLFAFILPVVILSILSGDIFEKIHPRFFIQKLTVFSIFIYFIAESLSAFRSNVISKYLTVKTQLTKDSARTISKLFVIVVISISTLICLSMIYDIFITVTNH